MSEISLSDRSRASNAVVLPKADTSATQLLLMSSSRKSARLESGERSVIPFSSSLRERKRFVFARAETSLT